MQIHNEDIFHCVRCGKMAQQQQQQPVPYCCGAPMARAACQTVGITAEPAVSPAGERSETPAESPSSPRSCDGV